MKKKKIVYAFREFFCQARIDLARFFYMIGFHVYRTLLWRYHASCGHTMRGAERINDGIAWANPFKSHECHQCCAKKGSFQA